MVGGRLKFAETTFEGIQREVLEETGEDFISPVLFAIVENFFCDVVSQEQFHEFLYIYKGRIQTKASYLDGEGGLRLSHGWQKQKLQI
nr:NUDIX domain-containing protein [Acinetobacter sp. NIPH 2699]